MVGKKNYEERLYINFQLSQRVPKDNFYRRLKGILDLHFLYKMVEPYYGKEGQKSIDPVVFFKLVLIGYLENVTSDRQLIEYASMRMDMLFFLGYDLDEPLPWHSTLSRTRRLLPKSMFEEVFNRILKMCIDSGLVAGHTQAVDSAYIKANASLDSLEVKQPQSSAQEYLNEIYKENKGPRRKAKQDKSDKNQRSIQSSKRQLKDLKTHQKWFTKKQGGPMGSQDPRAQYLSNKTHYSPVDPDARIAVKPGKPRQLAYSGQLSVDTSNHVITNIQAYYADRKDSRYLVDIIRTTRRRLKNYHLVIKRILADTGYSSGENYRYLENNNIEAYIPAHAQYESKREGFTYEPEKDRWRCTQGKYVTYRKTKYQKGHPEKHYLTTRSDCKGCPLASKCIGKSHEKRIRITVYRDQYDRAIERVTSIKGKQMKILRQSTVEPVFGTLINYGGMRKINTRGIEQANKVMLMAASAYNLKKLMNYIEKHRKIAAMVIKKEIIKQVENCVLIFNVFYTAIKDTIKYTTFDIQKCTTPRSKFLLTSYASKTELFN